MIISNDWKDYQCLTTGDGEKVEKFGKIIVRRPDPEIIWPKDNNSLWNDYDAIYHRSSSGGGSWEYRKKIPDSWTISYKDLTFKISPTNFKHTGLFPEQAVNWDYIRERLNLSEKPSKVLNLFAYTGGATMAAASSNTIEVVHVDASRGMNEWAKENMQLNHLENKKIRFITDDVMKFLDREKRRERKYDAVIMDPPSYGRGPSGEVWRLEDNLGQLLEKVKVVLSPDFNFVLINCYTTGFSAISLYNLLKLTFPNYKIETGEIGLPVVDKDLILPCGIYGRITRD